MIPTFVESPKPSKRDILLAWIFGFIGGMLLQFGIWSVVFFSAPILWLTVTFGALFAILGILFATRAISVAYPSAKLAGKIAKTAEPLLSNSRWPLQIKV